MATSTVSSAGIGSGLDVNSIVTQLMAIEKQPLTALQTKASKIQSTVSEYGKVKSTISTLKDLSTKLASMTTWAQTTSTSSDAKAVTASTSGSAPGNYSVAVQSLASVQTLATSVFPSAAATPGAGTLHIELGTWGAGQTSFTPNAGATAVDIAVAATDTLTDVRDKINASGAGVTALIMTDATGSRLLIRSNTTGADNAFRTSGLAGMNYDTGAKDMTQNQTAANAAATVNGLAVSSPTNTLSNIVDGLTLKLSAVTAAPVSVDVVTDTDALKKTMTDFAAAYSAVVQLISTDTKYDAVNKKGGILQGDSMATSLQRQLRTLAGSTSGASTMFAHLSDVGLEVQIDGSMTVNATKVDNALANLGELKKMFSNSNVLDATQDGFAKRFKTITTTLLASDGSVTTRTAGLANELTKNQKDQDSLSLRLASIEKRMRAQYTALDATMARLNSTSTYLTNQIAAYNKSTG
ncbi:MAG: flagellar filament capping protein FliD [Burkholderiales bacterium]